MHDDPLFRRVDAVVDDALRPGFALRVLAQARAETDAERWASRLLLPIALATLAMCTTVALVVLPVGRAQFAALQSWQDFAHANAGLTAP